MKTSKSCTSNNCLFDEDTKRPMVIRWRQLLPMTILSLSLYSHIATAKETLAGLNINPFVSQSAVYTSDNNFHGNSDDGISLDSNEIGAVLNYKVNDALNFSAQLMARNAGGMDNDSVRADYAFAQYRIASSMDYSLAIKAGKLRLPYGLYNDTRDVATTNPGFILPQSVYIDRARNTFYAANGATIHGENFWGANSIVWDFGSVKIEPDDNEMDDLAGIPTANGAKGTFKPIARVIFNFDNDTYRAGFSYRDSKFEFTPEIENVHISTGSVESEANLLSLQYNTEKWTLTSEWGRTKTAVAFTPEEALIPFVGWVPVNLPIVADLPTESFYLQLEYRITPDVTLLLSHDESYSNRNDRDGQKFSATLNNYVAMLPALAPIARPSYSQYALDNVLGISWKITPDMLTRIEWHNVEGTFWLSGSDNRNAFAMEKFWNMVAVQFAYRF